MSLTRLRVSPAALIVAALVVGTDMFVVGASAQTREPKAPGTLMLINGRHQDLATDFRDHFFNLAGGKQARIVVIPTAVSGVETDKPDEFLNPWRESGPRSVQLLHTRDRKTADDPAFVQPLTEATAVFFTNGHADRIFNAYRGTLVQQELKKLLDRGGLVGGTGTGMEVLGELVAWHLDPGFEPALNLLPGFLLNDGEPDRFAEILAANPRQVSLLIDRGSAVVIRGQQARVLGKGSITVHITKDSKEALKINTFKSGDEFDLDQLRRAAGALPSIVGIWNSLDRHASMGSLYQPVHSVRKREGVVCFEQQGDRLTGFAVVGHYKEIVFQERWTEGRTPFTSVRFADNQLMFEFPIDEWRVEAAPLSVEAKRQPNRGLVRVEARLEGDKLKGKWSQFTADGTEVFRGEWDAWRAEVSPK